jgi:hypothetical protein
MMAAGMKRSRLEFGRGVPVRPQRVRNRPETFSRARARLPVGSSPHAERHEVEKRMIVRERSQLADQPGHEVDADRRHLALAGGGQERPPLLGAAVEDGDPEVGDVWPGCDLGRPHGRGH